MTNNDDSKRRICMIVQQRDVKGGIAAVTNGYYGSRLEDDYDVRYVESYRDGSKWDKLLKALKGYLEFQKVLNEFKPSLVHIHSSFGPSFYRMQPFLYMAKRRGIPVVDHCHGADFDAFFENASDEKKDRIKKVYSKFDKVVVLSEEWRDRFSEVIPREKLVVIPNYCKPQSGSFVEDRADERFDGKKILFLGEIGQRKGGFDLPDIIARTSKKVPGAEFVICGDGAESDVQKIKEEIRKKCPGTKVSFPGWVRGEDKERVLRNAAIFLLPSYNEGLPMSILDAMAYGLPVVSTLVGGIPQLVHDGANGCLYKPGDTEGMAAGIASLLDDVDYYRAASLASLEVASSKYGFDRHLELLESVYDSLPG